MAHMTSHIHKVLDEFIDNIKDQHIIEFLKSLRVSGGNESQAVNFGSDDFQLVFDNLSKDAATAGWFIIELRANPKSEHKAIKAVARSSTKFNQNQRRFALIMLTGHVLQWLHPQHMKMALKASPVWKKEVINKVHVVFDEDSIRWEAAEYGQTRRPKLRDGKEVGDMFKYIPVPFDGFNVDGTELSKQEKKAGSSK